ncbi:hypothetical protein CAOG_005862 [Capsaspora owczarzaki ATCC 30864]|uniref:Uncharacterized protein n=1 Tax=Capsaspora owczarzaki (strain ATCC 30864) TaxID=595528 RepID=A0A0D2WU68_CAPO3|nr:hypothetical protein CAOG_005862 [Capsaspora owczarzaki ATCC 30864]
MAASSALAHDALQLNAPVCQFMVKPGDAQVAHQEQQLDLLQDHDTQPDEALAFNPAAVTTLALDHHHHHHPVVTQNELGLTNPLLGAQPQSRAKSLGPLRRRFPSPPIPTQTDTTATATAGPVPLAENPSPSQDDDNDTSAALRPSTPPIRSFHVPTLTKSRASHLSIPALHPVLHPVLLRDSRMRLSPADGPVATSSSSLLLQHTDEATSAAPEAASFSPNPIPGLVDAMAIAPSLLHETQQASALPLPSKVLFGCHRLGPASEDEREPPYPSRSTLKQKLERRRKRSQQLTALRQREETEARGARVLKRQSSWESLPPPSPSSPTTAGRTDDCETNRPSLRRRLSDSADEVENAIDNLQLHSSSAASALCRPRKRLRWAENLESVVFFERDSGDVTEEEPEDEAFDCDSNDSPSSSSTDNNNNNNSPVQFTRTDSFNDALSPSNTADLISSPCPFAFGVRPAE